MSKKRITRRIVVCFPHASLRARLKAKRETTFVLTFPPHKFVHVASKYYSQL